MFLSFQRLESINIVFIDRYYNINIYDSIEFKYRLDAYNAKGRQVGRSSISLSVVLLLSDAETITTYGLRSITTVYHYNTGHTTAGDIAQAAAAYSLYFHRRLFAISPRRTHAFHW